MNKKELIAYIKENQYARPVTDAYNAAVKELRAIKELERAVAHDKGEDCEDEECQECCGEFHGHDYDADEGGYCACGANVYEMGEP